MNRYILIHRLRGPAFLLLIGVMALLAQAHILGWGQSWPLLLILAGVLQLAERAALTEQGYPFFGGPQGPGPNPGGAVPSSPIGTQPPAEPGTAIVPVNDFGKDLNGGHS